MRRRIFKTYHFVLELRDHQLILVRIFCIFRILLLGFLATSKDISWSFNHVLFPFFCIKYYSCSLWRFAEDSIFIIEQVSQECLFLRF